MGNGVLVYWKLRRDKKMDSLMKKNIQIIKDFCKDVLICQESCPFYSHISDCCEFTPEPIVWDLDDSGANRDYEDLLDDVYDTEEAI